MPGGFGVGAAVLARRVVAAADVAALRAPTQVEPPSALLSHSTQPALLGAVVSMPVYSVTQELGLSCRSSQRGERTALS
jgi:hypothetical protein